MLHFPLDCFSAWHSGNCYQRHFLLINKLVSARVDATEAYGDHCNCLFADTRRFSMTMRCFVWHDHGKKFSLAGTAELFPREVGPTLLFISFNPLPPTNAVADQRWPRRTRVHAMPQSTNGKYRTIRRRCTHSQTCASRPLASSLVAIQCLS